jgi:hypothetical protein
MSKNKTEFNTIKLSVPNELINTNTKGKFKDVKTLTKTGALTTRGGKKSIIINTNNNNDVKLESTGINLNKKEIKKRNPRTKTYKKLQTELLKLLLSFSMYDEPGVHLNRSVYFKILDILKKLGSTLKLDSQFYPKDKTEPPYAPLPLKVYRQLMDSYSFDTEDKLRNLIKELKTIKYKMPPKREYKPVFRARIVEPRVEQKQEYEESEPKYERPRRR